MKKMKRWAKLNAAAWGVIVLAMAEYLPTRITELWQFWFTLGVEAVICWLIWKSLSFAFGQ